MHEEGWFHKCYSEWGEELFLTERTLRTYFNEFVNLGYIETRIMKIKGVRTLLLRPLMDKITDALLSIIETLNAENNDQKLPQPERIAVSKLYENCPNRKNLPDSQTEIFAVSNTIYTDNKDQIIKHTHVSDETVDLSYTNFDKPKEEKEMSDYLSNQQKLANIPIQLVESADNYTKSDYCESQINKKTTSKTKVQFDINDMLNDNPHKLSADLLEGWKVNRKAKKAPITARVWKSLNKFLSACQELGIESSYAFETTVNRCWIFPEMEWLMTKEQVAKREEAKRRSIELEERAAREKQKEIEKSSQYNKGCSKAVSMEFNKMKDILAANQFVKKLPHNNRI